MRWADLDVLNHVNNVTYLEYAAEAQGLLVADGAVRPDRAVDVTVTFLAPLLLSLAPVTVVSTFDADVLTQEIRSGDDASVVNARVVSTWRQVPPLTVPDGAEGPIPVRVRVGDVDATGAVTLPKIFELFQESRVLLIADHLPRRTVGQFVVGTVAVQTFGELHWRVEPYLAHGWLSRVGNGSFTIESVVSDGERHLLRATSVLVGFDVETQRSRAFTEEERAVMAAAVLA